MRQPFWRVRDWRERGERRREGQGALGDEAIARFDGPPVAVLRIVECDAEVRNQNCRMRIREAAFVFPEPFGPAMTANADNAQAAGAAISRITS